MDYIKQNNYILNRCTFLLEIKGSIKEGKLMNYITKRKSDNLECRHYNIFTRYCDLLNRKIETNEFMAYKCLLREYAKCPILDKDKGISQEKRKKRLL